MLLKVYQPAWLLKFDLWCELKLGIDLIKQEKKWFEKHPLLHERIQALEKDSHPPCPLECFDGYDDLIKRIDEIEKKQAERFPHLINRIENLEKK